MVNHEIVKIATDSPGIVIATVYLALFLPAFFIKPSSSRFMDMEQTNQLKGLAILLVFAGHIDKIVPKSWILPDISFIGVSIFLFCSGFGLMTSAMKRDYTVREFAYKRLLKIFIPYWIITAIIIPADVLLLGKHYSVSELIMTLMGINITYSLKRLDYARWFITYILIMYAFFISAVKLARTPAARASAILLMVIVMAAVLTVFRGRMVYASGFIGYIGYCIFFPLGAYFAIVKDRFSFANKSQPRPGWAGAASVITVLAYLWFCSSVAEPFRAEISSHALNHSVFAAETIFSLAPLLLALYFGGTKAKSAYLAFIGGISFEVFLLHGIIMVKYDFILPLGSFPIMFPLLFAVVLLAAYAFNRTVSALATKGALRRPFSLST
ncbi:MAG TPA: acyltransferase [Nitrospirota bacterium]